MVYHHWKSSCTEAMQSFIIRFNQYSLVDPSSILGQVSQLGLTPCRGLTIDFESYDAAFDTTVILETEFHKINNIFIYLPIKLRRNWKIVSTINVTYAPIQINWARNIAFNYFSQQQPVWSFTTVSNGYSLWSMSSILGCNLISCLYFSLK